MMGVIDGLIALTRAERTAAPPGPIRYSVESGRLYNNGEYIMHSSEDGNRYFGSLHILYRHDPSDTDGRFVEVRQWLTADGEHSDLIIEQGSLRDDDLQTESLVMPFHFSVEQALEKVNGRKGE